MVSTGEIRDDGGSRMAWCNVEHIGVDNLLTAKPASIGIIGNFKYVSADIRGIALEEDLYIVTVNALPVTKAKPWPDRFKA
jgi:hypothetical protein